MLKYFLSNKKYFGIISKNIWYEFIMKFVGSNKCIYMFILDTLQNTVLIH